MVDNCRINCSFSEEGNLAFCQFIIGTTHAHTVHSVGKVDRLGAIQYSWVLKDRTTETTTQINCIILPTLGIRLLSALLARGIFFGVEAADSGIPLGSLHYDWYSTVIGNQQITNKQVTKPAKFLSQLPAN